MNTKREEKKDTEQERREHRERTEIKSMCGSFSSKGRAENLRDVGMSVRSGNKFTGMYLPNLAMNLREKQCKHVSQARTHVHTHWKKKDRPRSPLALALTQDGKLLL